MTDVSKFVVSFLKDHTVSDDVISAWEEKKFQKQFRQRIMKSSAPRSVKDPNAPKRARSSYLFFCEDERPVIKAANPELKSKEITRKLGESWNALKDAASGDKPNKKAKARLASYEKKAEADKVRYSDAKENYVAPTEITQARGGRAKKDPNAPKRGKSGYILFCADERPKVVKANPEMKPKDITKELGVRWNSLKETKPKIYAKYEKKAEADKARYQSELEAYNANSGVVAEEEE